MHVVDLEAHAGQVVERVTQGMVGLEADRIILISAGTYDHAYAALRDAGLPVVDVRLPFPGSGQQRRFLDEFTEALRRHP